MRAASTDRHPRGLIASLARHLIALLYPLAWPCDEAVDAHGVQPRLGESRVLLAILAEVMAGARREGPSSELIAAIVETAESSLGCRRIAQQIAFLFGVMMTGILCTVYSPAAVRRSNFIESGQKEIASGAGLRSHFIEASGSADRDSSDSEGHRFSLWRILEAAPTSGRL